ncbi:ABC transporter substrate-binding protein [Pseudonocardia xinjiangensis]|uniref:Sugar ABC transporter substrate-binding protein n=1 Tax=Pseudonocardia xinjiangensis TaxID=75289 RepID=A0ABX1R5G8_9PSEU|nr:sugar ABC transporter substrate-binding protein [Pseudonocardia xinjiangensis]NMH75643.1 sugar ABC transporter substrate-binding protein [Pseudonocardia xinjiangensis]
MQRRMLRGAALVVAAALVLAGCGIGAGPTDVGLTDKPVTLTMSWWGADARTQKTLEAIKLFEADHPNIKVEPQYADWNGYWDRLATTTAAGDMPDVMQFDEVYLTSYANRGTLLDLQKVSSVLDTSALSPDTLDSGRVGGTLDAVPIGAAPNGVIINKTLFDQYGVALPDTATWTWEQFTQAAVQLQTASGGKVNGVSLFGNDAFPLNIWARQHGDQLYGSDGKVAISPETVASYFQRELDWIKAGASGSASEWAEGNGNTLDQADIVTGRVGMMFIPAGSLTSYQSAAPKFTYVIANWPTDPDTKPGFQYLKPSMYWAASARSEHPAEAGLLINFLTNDIRVAKLFGVDRGVPANPKFRDALSAGLDANTKMAFDFTAAMATESGPAPAPTPNGASDVQTMIGRYNQQALFGQLSPEDAGKAFVEELQRSIDAAS